MQGGVIGGIYLLAFLLSKGRAEDIETSKSISDGEDVKQTQSDLKSGSNDAGFPTAPFNPFNEELGPYNPPGGGYSNNPDRNSYPYSSPYPYNPGLNSMQAQPDVNNRIYPPGYSGSPNLSPYDQGPNLPLFPTQGDRESHLRTLESISVNSQSVPRTSARSDISYFSSSYPYKHGLGSKQINSEPYQAVPLPDPSYSKYDSMVGRINQPQFTETKTDSQKYQSALARYESNLKLNQGQNFAPSFYHTQEKNQYQPLRSSNNPKLYELSLVPYKELSFPITKLSPQQEQTISKQYGYGSDDASLISSFYSHALRSNVSQEDVASNQSIPIPDSEPSYKQTVSNDTKEIEQNDARQFVPSSQEIKSDPLSPSYSNVSESSENNPEVEDIDSSPDVESRLHLAYPRLYPSGAGTATAYAAVRPATSGVPYAYTSGQRPIVIDFPSETPQSPAGVFTNGQSSPIAFEDAKSRVISPYEYVFPNQVPGGENVIQCQKENEFHHFWSKGQGCFVCICLNEYGLLSPVCASCGGCDNPTPATPESIPPLPESITIQPASPEPYEPVRIVPVQPVGAVDAVPTPAPSPEYAEPPASPSPGPEYVPQNIPTLPTPTPGASCDPLPNGEPFPNPLHPCQICVCKETSLTGKFDVQIECKEDPQCIVPDDVTTLPPIPDEPMPIPLPMCEKLPENVLFPHPTESCKLCKCAKSMSDTGVPEQQITCYPHPDCLPKLEPVTESPPPLPIPIEPQKIPPVPEPVQEPFINERETYSPAEPVPLPEIVTIEPLPWPPITTLAPITTPGPPLTPRAGPLPGPSPHESCLPYPPNQMFQHPWDECQICMCAEAVAAGLTNVEVNCYTKPSCCIEPPDAVKKALPGFNLPYPGLGNAAVSPDVSSLPNSPTGVITSTYRPPPTYIHYTPRPASTYPSNKAPVETLPQPPGYSSQSFPRLPETGFPDPTSSYPYQPNYASSYVHQQYPEYPPRLPQPASAYKPSGYEYPPNYPYGRQGYKFDPRFSLVSSPNVYSSMYGYNAPPAYPPGKGVSSYPQPPVSGPTPIKSPSLVPSYSPTAPRSKSGNDASDDLDDT
ncbi:SH3 domain-containing protein C23A1.17-like [Helicoverpa zea]|uniref:SH3 domain-containing protein C23A1.17-like n=1 Tax=Helicoverpa zea TaxID=7113 RepID=UPI001F55DD8E|nr:SH3 domain-containing protein C23A1.17-like [Helicoverpa zea]